MPDALPDATLPISRLGTGSNNGRGWGLNDLYKGKVYRPKTNT
jgi:hypothetical protein